MLKICEPSLGKVFYLNDKLDYREPDVLFGTGSCAPVCFEMIKTHFTLKT